ncbi:MAG: heat-inducible transcription repressor HrcA [Clostridia bacterium]|nr:heat-inducible transcription repressor HrcA [Clostridia bacterium]
MELSDRKKRILKSIIDAYITSGDPVGSKFLTTHSDFTVSSATIRNEMNELETMGYLEQPHTSSGRVPSPMGYRAYVDGLMESYRLKLEEIALLDELMRFKLAEMDSVMEEAGRVLSNITDYTAFTAITRQGITAKRFEIVPIDSDNVLIVMICTDGTVKTQMTLLPSPHTPEGLKRLSEALNVYLVGITADKITLPVIMSVENRALGDSMTVSAVLKCIYSMMKSDKEASVNFSGIPKLLNYPEFSDVQKTKEVLQLLDDKKSVLKTVLDSEPGKTYILISGEEHDAVPSDTSFVFRPITVDGESVGALGVIGPRRMNYRKVIASLEYIADGLNDNVVKNNSE